jgi:hypothetical protein
MAAAIVNVNMRIDHMRDVRRVHPETRSLAHHIIADLGPDGQTCGPALAQASDGIRDRVAVHTGIKEHPPFGVDEEITGHGDGYLRARVTVRKKDVPVKL